MQQVRKKQTTIKPLHDKTALTPEEVFRQYAPRIYTLARRMLGNEADAEDVTQEVLLQVVRNLSTFRGESSLPTWLHRVTVNAALAYRRKRAVREKHRIHDPLDQFTDLGGHRAPVRRWALSPLQPILDKEAQQVIDKAIAQLPDMYRHVYVLADIEGLPNDEIASLLGLKVVAVKSRLHRARLWMRNALAPYFEERAA